jgi:hypothetical protein
VQAGGGALCDLLYENDAKGGLGRHGHRHGVFVTTQVMSVSSSGERAMGDAGFKALGWHPFGGLPGIRGRPDLEVTGLSAEHCKIYAKKGEAEEEEEAAPLADVRLRRGDALALIPGYVDAMGYGHSEVSLRVSYRLACWLACAVLHAQTCTLQHFLIAGVCDARRGGRRKSGSSVADCRARWQVSD